MSILDDAVSLAGSKTPKRILRTMLINDSFHVLALLRARQFAKKWKIPFVNRLLRLWQMACYGIDLGGEIELGCGVKFVHTVGTVIGGNSRLGACVHLMGRNTIGTAKDNGYPVIGDNVTIGCGACVLGPVYIGDGVVIGANAVVLHDVDAGSTVAGVPAKKLSSKR